MDADDPRGGAPRQEDGAPLGPPRARWSALGCGVTAIASFAAAFGVSFGVAFALGIARRAPQERTAPDLLIVTALSDGALLLVMAVLGRWLLRLRASDLGLRRPSRGALAYAAFAAGALWLSAILVNVVQVSLFGPHPQSLVVSVGAHAGPLAFALDLLTGAVIAPLAEELFYRGLIFGGLARMLPFAIAAPASALAFALPHGLGVVAPIFVLGLGLAYVYARTGTLWAPVLAHALVNTVSLALVFALPRISGP